MRVLDLFSAAAGGWSLGMHRAGYRTVAACEYVDWRRALYLQNNPDVVMYDDVRTLTADRIVSDLGYFPECVVGSPPCQDISSANTKGKGVEGERSGLYFEAIRIIGEGRPRWIALENSSNLRTRGADAVLAALEAIGYSCWSFVVRASDIGANHERPRSWIIGCDVEQVADADGVGRHEGWGGRRIGLDVSLSQDPCHTPQDGRGQGLSRGCAEPVAGLPVETCGDAAHANHKGQHAPSLNGEVAKLRRVGGYSEPSTLDASSIGHESRWPRRHGPNGNGAAPVAEGTGNTPDTNEEGQEVGLLESSLRQAQEPDDGRGAGWSADGEGPGEMGLCEADRIAAFERRPDWSLDDFAYHIRLDVGLSAWLAEQRIAVGGPRGASAASLIVEAFGDSVVPQIPEAIGKAIMRTERALAVIYGKAVA